MRRRRSSRQHRRAQQPRCVTAAVAMAASSSTAVLTCTMVPWQSSKHHLTAELVQARDLQAKGALAKLRAAAPAEAGGTGPTASPAVAPRPATAQPGPATGAGSAAQAPGQAAAVSRGAASAQLSSQAAAAPPAAARSASRAKRSRAAEPASQAAPAPAKVTSRSASAAAAQVPAGPLPSSSAAGQPGASEPPAGAPPAAQHQVTPAKPAHKPWVARDLPLSRFAAQAAQGPPAKQAQQVQKAPEQPAASQAAAGPSPPAVTDRAAGSSLHSSQPTSSGAAGPAQGMADHTEQLAAATVAAQPTAAAGAGSPAPTTQALLGAAAGTDPTLAGDAQDDWQPQPALAAIAECGAPDSLSSPLGAGLPGMEASQGGTDNLDVQQARFAAGSAPAGAPCRVRLSRVRGAAALVHSGGPVAAGVQGTARSSEPGARAASARHRPRSLSTRCRGAGMRRGAAAAGIQERLEEQLQAAARTLQQAAAQTAEQELVVAAHGLEAASLRSAAAEVRWALCWMSVLCSSKLWRGPPKLACAAQDSCSDSSSRARLVPPP